MSTLLSVLPPKGKSAPVADPSVPDTGSVSRSAPKKKTRVGELLLSSRKKPFRQHLDQAMGKGESVPVVPAAVEKQDFRPAPVRSSAPVPSPSPNGRALPEGHKSPAAQPLPELTPAAPAPEPLRNPTSGQKPLLSPTPVSSPGKNVPAVPESPSPLLPRGFAIPPADSAIRTKTPGGPPVESAKASPDRQALPDVHAATVPARSPALPVPPPSLSPAKTEDPVRRSGKEPFRTGPSGSLSVRKEIQPHSSFPDEGKGISGASGMEVSDSGGTVSSPLPSPAGDRPSAFGQEGDPAGRNEPDKRQVPDRQGETLTQSLPAAVGPLASGTVSEKAPGEAVRVPEFPDRVMEAARKGGGQITLQVHPPALGPVRVTVRVDPGSKTVEVHLGVKDASVRKALEGKESDLKQLLHNEGFSMNKLDVSVGVQGGGTLSSSGANPSQSPSDAQSGGTGSPPGGNGSFSADLSGGGSLLSGENRGGRGGEAMAPGSGPRESSVGGQEGSGSDPVSMDSEDGRYHRIA